MCQGTAKTISLSLLLLVFGGPSAAQAWNNLGHKVVAEIAWRQLDPPTRQQIVDVLRRHPRFDTDFAAKMEDPAQSGDKETQDHWIFQQAATWPDEIRKNREYDHPSWHYINEPVYLHAVDKAILFTKLRINLSDKYSSWVPKKELNVLQAISYSQATIASKASAEDKAVAYCWLLHLVGDIHQPLHATALYSVERFPEGDEGGNKIPLAHGKNLHAVWDNLLGKRYYMRDVEKTVNQLSNRDEYGDAWDTAGKEVDPKNWAEEGRSLCESFVYPEALLTEIKNTPANEKLEPFDLPKDYLREAGHQARLRVIAAGVRLGVLLNNASHTK